MEASTGKQISRFRWDTYKPLAFSPDIRMVIAVVENGPAGVFETATGREITEIDRKSSLRAAEFSPDGRWIVTGDIFNTAAKPWFRMRVFKASSGRQIWQSNYSSMVRGVSFSPDSRLIATASLDGRAQVLDIATGRMVHQLTDDNGSQGPLYDVNFSPDGRWIAVGGIHGVQTFDTATGKEVSHWIQGAAVAFLRFSSDSRWVVTGNLDGSARVFEAATGREISRLQCRDIVLQARFSRDSRWVAAGSNDGAARIFDAGTDARIVQDVSRDGNGNSEAFSPDDRLLAVVAKDNSVRVFALASR